jgi:hypothetical protein
MQSVVQSADRFTANCALRSTSRIFFLIAVFLGSGAVSLHSQCPNTGETKVFNSKQGAGFYFYRFQGAGSFRYFLDGKTFSLNDKDDPGKTFLFIDKMVYEPLLLARAEMKDYVKSSKSADILREQAKHSQELFKSADASMVITDYGPAARKGPDGSDDRLFYLWKKVSAPAKTAATQFLVSTVVQDGVFVMSFMSPDASVTDEDLMREVQSYTSHFDLLSSKQCAQALAMPGAP